MINGLIVVGVDGSEPSRAALRWALEEARLRGAPLRVLNSWHATPASLPESPLVTTDFGSLNRAANEFVETFRHGDGRDSGRRGRHRRCGQRPPCKCARGGGDRRGAARRGL